MISYQADFSWLFITRRRLSKFSARLAVCKFYEGNDSNYIDRPDQDWVRLTSSCCNPAQPPPAGTPWRACSSAPTTPAGTRSQTSPLAGTWTRRWRPVLQLYLHWFNLFTGCLLLQIAMIAQWNLCWDHKHCSTEIILRSAIFMRCWTNQAFIFTKNRHFMNRARKTIWRNYYLLIKLSSFA